MFKLFCVALVDLVLAIVMGILITAVASAFTGAWNPQIMKMATAITFGVIFGADAMVAIHKHFSNPWGKS